MSISDTATFLEKYIAMEEALKQAREALAYYADPNSYWSKTGNGSLMKMATDYTQKAVEARSTIDKVLGGEHVDCT